MSRICIYPEEMTTDHLVCRGCLATDARLYDMRQNRLMEAYCSLLSNEVQVIDELSYYLCSYCAVLLLKFDAFRSKCISAQVAFENVDLTITIIKQIDRPTYFRQSFIQTIDIDGKNETVHNPDKQSGTVKQEIEIDDTNNLTDKVNFMKKSNSLLMEIFNSDNNGEPGHVNDLIKEFKFYLDCKQRELSRNIEDQRIKQLAEMIINIQLSSNTRAKLLEILEDLNKRNLSRNPQNKINTTILNKQTKLKLNDVVSDSESNGVKHEKNHEIIPVEFDNDGEIIESNSDLEDELAIADLKMNLKSSKRKTANAKTKLKLDSKIGKTNTKRKARTKNVSKLYNMNEIDLSNEEQIREMEDRKNSDSYLQARFKCNFCFKGFQLEETFKSHMVIHDDKSGKYVCDLCHCHFINNVRLRKHKYNHGKRFNCRECNFFTKYVSQAKEHYKWHGGVKDKCKHCGKEFSGQSSYYLHLKMYHPTSVDVVRCELCGESCSGTRGLKIHEKRTHKEMYSLECRCSGCDTQFYCSSALKAHQGAAGLCDPRAKFCVRCGRSFDTEQLLREHEAEERKPRTMFKCKECNKSFEGFTSLKKHQLQHSLTVIRMFS